MIGDDVQITVVEVKGDKVRLGIQAPRALQVHRKEVYDAIHAANADAAITTAGAAVFDPAARATVNAATPQRTARPIRLAAASVSPAPPLPRSA